MSTEMTVLLIVVAVLAGLVFWVVKAGYWAKAKEFLSEVRAEMRKVTFPARDEVVGTTIVVIVTSFVFAIFLFAADKVIIWGYQGIVRVFG
jgi:preprotein translocase subunit SecE